MGGRWRRGRRYSQLEDVEDLLCVGGLDWDIGGELEVLQLCPVGVVVVALLFYAELLRRWVVAVRGAFPFFCGLFCPLWIGLLVLQLRR